MGPAVLRYRSLPFYLTKMTMARARSHSSLVLSTQPRVLKAIAVRQQAAAQLAASGAVTVLDAAAGKASVRGQNETYNVTASTTELACTCADAAKGYACKHVRAAVTILGNAEEYVRHGLFRR